MGNIYLSAVLAFALAMTGALAANAQTVGSDETLNQYISGLQKNPNDTVLREQIIRRVLSMRTQPAISPEAEKFDGRAEFAVRNAKNEADFLDAAAEYEKALLIAPWVSVYYFNQGVAFEKGGKLIEAKRSFEFYLLSAPAALDARDVRKRIAGLEYGAEKAARKSTPEIAPREAKGQDDWSRRLDGARYTACNEYNSTECVRIDIRGGSAYFTGQGTGEEGPLAIEFRRFAGWSYRCFDGRSGRAACVISEDGERITCTYCEGENPPRVLKRNR